MRRTLTALAVLALVAACAPPQDEEAKKEARLRNEPPVTCTSDDAVRCLAPVVTECPDGTEPVLDYASDCCAHFSCQPLCVAARPCPMAPAPICPAGTELWIGTAIEDCCPAYRCVPNNDVCANSERPVACALAYPYCGDGIEPIVVGQTPDCCPIYQCPCVMALDPTRPGIAPNPNECGCTSPACGPGEQIACAGIDRCGGPCKCEPVQSQCMDDSECGPNRRCEKACPLTSNGTSPPTCDVGVCVDYVVDGCRADFECPTGQRCEMQCMGWGCAPSSNGSPDACACPAGDPRCSCDPTTGVCQSEECKGQCVPVNLCPLDGVPADGVACPRPVPPDPTCEMVQVGVDPNNCCAILECARVCSPTSSSPVACTAMMPDCGGVSPVAVGVDPATCCPIYDCPKACEMMGRPCAMPDCMCPVATGTDPSGCCPIFECKPPLADGTCPPGIR